MGRGQTKSSRRGFTLIECAIVTVIVGVGTVAVLQLMASGTMSNAESSELTTGLNMANDIKELSRGLAFDDPTLPANWGAETGESSIAAYDDLDDLDGVTFSPPIDARRLSLSTFTNWKQTVTVETVNPASISTSTTKGSQPINRLTVKVYKNDNEVCQLTWLVSEAQ
jgi:prepilin-type N-terminal cleavage/methylation domain-containing protein